MSLKVSQSQGTIGRSLRTVVRPWFAGVNYRHISSATITLPGPSSANAKSAWTQVFSSTASDSSVLGFGTWAPSAPGLLCSAIIDIGVGAAGSESVIVPNMLYGPLSNAIHHIPVFIPAGSRVAIRHQAAIANLPQNFPSFSLNSSQNQAFAPASLDSIGVNLSTTLGTQLSGTSGAWTELTAATSQAYQGGIFCPGIFNTTSLSNVTVVFTVGYGAAGSETALADFSFIYASTPRINDVGGASFNGGRPAVFTFGAHIPAGARIVVRHNASSGGANLTAAMMGIPYR